MLGSGNLTTNSKYRHGSGCSWIKKQTYAGVISGTWNFIKTGMVHLTLTGNNTYTGTTSVSAGVLKISGSGNISNNSAVTVASGANLILSKSVTVGSIAGAGKIRVKWEQYT